MHCLSARVEVSSNPNERSKQDSYHGPTTPVVEPLDTTEARLELRARGRGDVTGRGDSWHIAGIPKPGHAIPVSGIDSRCILCQNPITKYDVTKIKKKGEA